MMEGFDVLITRDNIEYYSYYDFFSHPLMPNTCHRGIPCRLRMNGAMRYLVLVHYCRQSF